jgi:hypothetical protein
LSQRGLAIAGPAPLVPASAIAAARVATAGIAAARVRSMRTTGIRSVMMRVTRRGGLSSAEHPDARHVTGGIDIDIVASCRLSRSVAAP